MFLRKILLFLAIAGAAYAGPVTWSLSNALFSDGGTFGSTFTNGNLNGLQLRLAPVLSLTNAGGVVNFDLNNVYLGECFNCSPNRLFVSGRMIGEAPVPEPSTVALTLLPLALGVLTVRRLRHRP
jgi:hypothetical protein